MNLHVKGVKPEDLKTVLGIVAGYSDHNDGEDKTYQLSDTKRLKIHKDGDTITAEVLVAHQKRVSDYDRLTAHKGSRKVYKTMEDYLNHVN
jgi:hypothetical protein